MNINQLLKIAIDISDSIRASGVMERYQQLIAFCKQQQAGGDASIASKVAPMLDDLSSSICAIGFDRWEHRQVHILEKLEDSALFSHQSIEVLLKDLEVGTIDVAALCQRMEGDNERLTVLLSRLSQLISSLELIAKPQGDTFLSTDVHERSHLMQIYFDEALFIRDIEQLEKFCRIWSSILSAFSTLTHEEKEDIRIYDIESSSITFYAGIGTLNALANSIHKALSQYERILAIRSIQHSIDLLDLDRGDEAVSLLETEIDGVVDTNTSTIAYDLLDKYGWNGDDASSVYSAVKVALKQMLNFVERGGRIYSSHAAGLKELNEKVIAMLKSQNTTGDDVCLLDETTLLAGDDL